MKALKLKVGNGDQLVADGIGTIGQMYTYTDGTGKRIDHEENAKTITHMVNSYPDLLAAVKFAHASINELREFGVATPEDQALAYLEVRLVEILKKVQGR